MPKANGYAKRDKEIERLRTAMVLAMADLEQLATHPHASSKLREAVARVAHDIEKSLEAE